MTKNNESSLFTDGIDGKPQTDREHDTSDGWRTAEELAEEWGVPPEMITEIAEELGLHDDPEMSRPRVTKK